MALLCFFCPQAHAQQKYTVASISVSGAEHLSAADIVAGFGSKRGDTLHEEILESDIANTLRHYESIGYPFARIIVAKVEPQDSSSLNISLRVEEGRIPRLVSVLVLGNSATDTSIITREFFLADHPLFNRRSLEASRTQLEHLGIFSEISSPEVVFKNDSSFGIVVTVTESHSTYIDGILGYNPSPFPGGSGFLSGFLALGFTNIGGTARNATLDFRRETHSGQELSASYSEPWLFGYPINAHIEFAQRDEDSIYTRTHFTIEPSLLLQGGLSISGTLAYDRIVPGVAHIVYDSKSYTFGLQAKLDTRDNISAPRSGYLFSVGGSYGSKSIEGSTLFDSLSSHTLTTRSLAFDASFAFKTFSERLVFVPSLSAKMFDLPSGQLDQSDLFRIGGLRTLRGYREAAFLVSQFVILHVDYRLMTGRTSYLGIFVDYGFLQRRATATFPSQSLNPLGYGFSLQFDTQLGLLSASIGLARSEPIDQAKLHFGILKDF